MGWDGRFEQGGVGNFVLQTDFWKYSLPVACVENLYNGTFAFQAKTFMGNCRFANRGNKKIEVGFEPLR